MHPKVLRGEMTEEQVLLEFLDTPGDASTHGNPDGKISISEFIEYYANVGASVESDEMFGTIVKNAWKLGDQADKFSYLRRSKAPSALQGVDRVEPGRTPYASEAITPRGPTEEEQAKRLGLHGI